MSATGSPAGEDGSGYLLYHSTGQYPGKAKALNAAFGEFARCWGSANDARGAILRCSPGFMTTQDGILRPTKVLGALSKFV